MKIFLSFLILISPLLAGGQQTGFSVPAYTKPVMDEARMLEGPMVEKISRALDSIYKKGGPQVAVLTVNSIGDLTIEEASMQVAKAWKLGTAEKDNAVILMVAKKERKIRIEVGQGVEGDLTDAYSRRIIDDVMVPFFKEGYFTEAVEFGVEGILKRMNPPIKLGDYIEGRASRREISPDKAGGLVRLMIIFFVLFILFGLGGGRGGRRSNVASGLAGFLIGSAMGGRGGSGFGGRGGGFSGGGGGGFSGGGASGSW